MTFVTYVEVELSYKTFQVQCPPPSTKGEKPQMRSCQIAWIHRNHIMTSERNHPNRSRAALVTLLCWFSARTEAASPLVQHRVRRAQRQVPYAHVLANRPRRRQEKFRRTTNTEHHVHNKILRHENEKYWVYASSITTTTIKQQKPEEGYFRRLIFDPFVGEDAIPGTNNQTNVTTEVDINGTLFNATGESTVYTISEEIATDFQPLRIRAVLAEDSDFLTTVERESLFHEMLSPALLSWSSALRVDPVVGNLTVAAEQLLDGEICGPGNGLPSISVPPEHLTVGIPDTDFIVYLNLAFTSPRNKTNTTALNSSKINGVGDNTVGDPPFGRGLRIGESAANDEGGNEENILQMDSTYICEGDYLAAASFCSTDQYDRPTAALLHICVDESFFLEEMRNRNILTLMHELGHAIGFNSLSMAHFRRPDGSPVTPRVDGDIPDTRIECTGPGVNRTYANVVLPSEEILQFREVRGGVRVAELVTPSILQVVRNQFDCQELMGAELESGERLPLEMLTEGHGCIGDHWERRLFSTDLMNPIVDEANFSPRISTLTLAYFADSGWYQVDLNYAKVAAGWGRGTGCNFVNNTCIGANGQVPPGNAPFFCNDVPPIKGRSFALDIHGCTPDLSRKAVCSMGQYDHELPKEFQYFNETFGPSVGGSDPFMDYCPVYAGFANGLCSNIQNEQYIKANQIETFGVRNSRCLVGDVGDNHQMALCLPIACVVEDQSLRIKVDNRWHRCDELDQVIQSGRASIVCPDPRRICPTFYCPYDCLGTGGICDYPSGQCLCEYANNAEEDEDGESSFLVAECGSVNDTLPGDGSSGPVIFYIIRPGESIDKTQVLPPLDSPLSDYYVPNSRSLEEKEMKTSWTLVICLGVGGVALIIVAFLTREWSKGQMQTEDVTRTIIHRNKDKMVATVLIDLRLHGAHQELDESLADTDGHLTESVASGRPNDTLSEISMSRYSEVLSEPDTSIGDVPADGIESEEMHEQDAEIIRHRKVGAAS